MTEGISRWKRPGRWVPLLILVFLIGSFTAYRVFSTSGVKQEVEEIRARGLPASAVELDKWYQRVPMAENAAMGYLDAYLSYTTPGKKKNPNEFPQNAIATAEPLPEDLAEAVDVYIAANEETVEKIHDAAKFKSSRYPIDLTKGPGTLLPHLAQVKAMAQLMKWDAIQHSKNGEQEKAVRSLESGFALSRSLRGEPLLISELVRIACAAILLPALERVVTEQVLTEEELKRLGAALQEADESGRAAMYRAMVGERGCGMDLFDLSFQEFEGLSAGGVAGVGIESVPELFRAWFFNLRRGLGMRDRDLAFYLEAMGELEKALEKDFPEMLRTSEKANTKIQKELKEHPIKYLVSGMILPYLATGVRKEVVLTGQIRCARMALAVERFRSKNGGQLPSPHQLVPDYLAELPRDPVDGEGLKYESLSKGYRIVSTATTALKKKGTMGTNFTEVAFTVLR